MCSHLTFFTCLILFYYSLIYFHTSDISAHAVNRAFIISGKLKPEEAVQATLSSLPDEVVDTVGVTSLPSEDSVSERRRKLDFLEMQEELIKVDENFLLFLRIYSLLVSRTVQL